MAAQRLHLPLPPSPPGVGLPRVPITHVYHNADPIPQGACTGITSLCAQAGYAIETRCHLGQTIVYDTVTRLGWHADVRKHPIKQLVLGVLERESKWPDGQDGGECEVPSPREEVDCVVGVPIRRVACKLTAPSTGLFQMGVWTFQAQDIMLFPAGVFIAQLYGFAKLGGERSFHSMVPGVVVVRCSHLQCILLYNMRSIGHSFLVILPSDDHTLNNHLPDVPVISAKLRFGVGISFQIVTPHGRVS